MTKLLNKREVAEALGICVRSVERYGVPAIKLSARRNAYNPDAVAAWLAARAVQPAELPEAA